ncbi:hypothetical protein V6N11_070671 [Hibiscus sabdariffa]|uniref:Uncharacterized protein n=1 Tax=Hibiscus sabdariffa TaxID=183260 RepID=A0ABR2QG46_9ROSI
MNCESASTILDLKFNFSYKDAEVGDLEISNDEDSIPFDDDDDLELFDEDIRVGVSEGISFIDFSTRVQELALKSMEFTLVLKILGRWNEIPPQTTPLEVVPAEPYGPWMLVEKRRRRPARAQSSIPNQRYEAFVSNSKYNPIYVVNNADSDSANVSDVPPQPLPSDIVDANIGQLVVTDQHVSNDIENVDIPMAPAHAAKAKGKGVVATRKPLMNILGTRNMNIMSKKHGPSVASPSRPTKGRSLASNLNPAKHVAVQLAATAAPVVLLRDSGSRLPADLPQFQVHVNDTPSASAMVE